MTGDPFLAVASGDGQQLPLPAKESFVHMGPQLPGFPDSSYNAMLSIKSCHQTLDGMQFYLRLFLESFSDTCTVQERENLPAQTTCGEGGLANPRHPAAISGAQCSRNGKYGKRGAQIVSRSLSRITGGQNKPHLCLFVQALLSQCLSRTMTKRTDTIPAHRVSSRGRKGQRRPARSSHGRWVSPREEGSPAQLCREALTGA